jgi:hypothetical protein
MQAYELRFGDVEVFAGRHHVVLQAYELRCQAISSSRHFNKS